MFRPRACVSPSRRAFTILELMTVIVVILILVVMTLPVFSILRARAQKAQCIGNLRSLHVAADNYMQDNHHWPQVANKGVSQSALATAWIGVFSPYGLQQINWVCPTVQQLLHAPDLSDPTNARIDYSPNPFDANPTSPFRWSQQPWFIETGNVHGNGQEIIFPDGHIAEAIDLLRTAQTPPPNPG